MSHLSTARLAAVSLLIAATTVASAVVVIVTGWAGRAEAQITAPRVLSHSQDRHAKLQEQLVNRLRATTAEQQAFLKYVVEQVEKRRLSFRLVVAVERYALKRNPQLPFLFFSCALRYQASKRGVSLPPVRQFATTRPEPSRAR